VRNHGGSPGKRLGVKKFSGAFPSLPHKVLELTAIIIDQYVIHDNIIVRQRGTQFHPGQHVRPSLRVISRCEPPSCLLFLGGNGSRSYTVCDCTGIRPFLQDKVDAGGT